MPFITLPESPLAGRQNVQLYYREYGTGGFPIVFLHGGWGYQIYPFDRQIEAFANQFRFLIPDRSGYGKSERIDSMSADFHRQAAQEMKTFLDALHLEQAILWGHSDGSVIAIHMALAEPHRFPGMILEAFHFYKNKPASHEFFDTMMRQPEALGERVVSVLSAEHGEEDWEKLIRMNGIAWLRIAEQAQTPQEDLFEGRLPDLQVPSFFLHGNRDPRTEADELARVQQQLPDAMIRLIDGGGHSPHSETSSAITTNQLAQEFFDYLRSQSSIP